MIPKYRLGSITYSCWFWFWTKNSSIRM